MKNIESEKKLERSLKNSVEVKLKGMCLKLLSAHITGLPDRLCLFPGGEDLICGTEDNGQETPEDSTFHAPKKLGL